jgi:acetyl esterase/lipase
MSPATDLAFTGKSIFTQKRLDPIFANAKSISAVLDYITIHDPRNPLISPLYANLKGLPPILIHVGDHEILRDDSTRFAERARAAGVDVELVVWPNMFHVFQMASQILPEARLAIQQITAFIDTHLDDPWPNIDNI